MEIVKLKEDIHLFCVKAKSFPEGIHGAQTELASLPLSDKSRNYFGVSYMYDDDIVYFAAAELKKGEAIPAGCDQYTLKSGRYISIHIADFRNDVSRIADAFDRLTSDARIDPKGCSAEWYLPEGSDHASATEVRCMVRLADR